MITHAALKQLDQHWAIQAFGIEHCREVFELVQLNLVKDCVGKQLNVEISEPDVHIDSLERLSMAYELAAIEGIDALLSPFMEEQGQALQEQAQAGAYRAFEIRRVMPLPEDEEARYFHILHLAALAYCGDRWADIRRWLKEHVSLDAYPQSLDGRSWDARILVYLYNCWVRLFRKDRWQDLTAVSETVMRLRHEQNIYEPQLLNSEQGFQKRAIAFRLVALYHWARATELLAIYMLQGEPVSVLTELDQHFEAALAAATSSQDPTLEMLLRWLYVAARRMVLGSIWHITQSVNSSITRFVKSISRSRSLLELLPPQKAALQEQGLLDQANHAVVVDLPTSGGKTLLAEFRILQALNQFDLDKGWVAYVAPTRALVGQLTRRLREDFGPIGIQVEQLTAAVEIDQFEEALFVADGREHAFDVLIATPEKLHLVIRNKKITRPLSLVVMDEAQNIEDAERGLRIELLLATIKRDCPYANFLLLMPHVPNASDLVRWLAPEAGKTISLGTSPWQPNERIVGMYTARQEADRGDWSLQFETLLTARDTLQLSGSYQVGGHRPLNIAWTDAKASIMQTAAMAKVFSERGTSIAIARSIADTWKMAREIARDWDGFPSEEIELVQRFLRTEMSSDFELVDLLAKGVAVHHAGLSEEVKSLIEWLAERGKLRVVCATTTIVQGINFPVSSIFLASRFLWSGSYNQEMSKLAFWNLAGRAGRLDQDSVGVVGLCAGKKPEEIRSYVKDAVDQLLSRLVTLLEEVDKAGKLQNLSQVIQEDAWADFRSYIAHLWNEKHNLDLVLNETEQVLRNTLGYGTLQSHSNEKGKIRARALLDATKTYAYNLADHPENASLADATGFSPEGVRTALLGLQQLHQKLTVDDWRPTSIFGEHDKSPLPQLIGVMMRVPELRSSFEELRSHGGGKAHIAEMARDWVMGMPIEDIAKRHFMSPQHSLTDAITDACRGIYRSLVNGGSWGLSAFTKLPSSGIHFEELPEDTKRAINTLPAMLYHGVSTEAAILMRMNGVPRSVAEPLGVAFQQQTGLTKSPQTVRNAREFLRSLNESDWQSVVPRGAAMSGRDYRDVWCRIAGEKPL